MKTDIEGQADRHRGILRQRLEDDFMDGYSREEELYCAFIILVFLLFCVFYLFVFLLFCFSIALCLYYFVSLLFCGFLLLCFNCFALFHMCLHSFCTFLKLFCFYCVLLL